MVKTIWKERKDKITVEKEAETELTEDCGLTPLSAKLLIKRGYDTADKVMAFLEPDTSDFYDPFDLPDMQRGIERILKAKEKDEFICIHGDYDADGTTAVAILTKYLRSQGMKVFYEIPNRLKEGYGMNIPALEKVINKGATLIISVDNGIAAHEQIDFCNAKGIDVIVTDHHECQGEIPKALAVIDAKREDSNYPFSELCGAGIAFKLIQGLDMALNHDTDMQEYIEMAAMATVADIVPLKSENRIIASLGIESLNHYPINKGISALINVSELKQVSAGNIGFILAPKINAAGRLGEALKVVDLYLTEDADKAKEIAEFLSMENKKRQEIEVSIFEQAKAQVETRHLDEKGIIVIWGEGWHSGVIGIVASRIQEIWYHPTVVIGIDEKGVGKGSCRSVEGFNIFEALKSCSDLFLSFGGHEQAAGFSMKADDFSTFEKRINTYAQSTQLENLLVKSVYYDAVMTLDDICDELVENLEQFEPFGVGNPGPVFKLESLNLKNAKKMGKENTHLMFSVPPYRCVGFGMGSIVDEGTEGQFSILCKPEFNCFRDVKSVQLLVKDIKRSPFYHNQSAWNLVEELKKADPDHLPELGLSKTDYKDIKVDREDIKLIYNLMRQVNGKAIEMDRIVREFKSLNIFKILAGLNILSEADLIRFKLRKGILSVEILKTDEKKDIQKTPLMVKLKRILTNKF
ncbi:MAG: single-stranded-DNA-specific exonuclease RecJ [Eubacterium sp.]